MFSILYKLARRDEGEGVYGSVFVLARGIGVRNLGEKRYLRVPGIIHTVSV